MSISRQQEIESKELISAHYQRKVKNQTLLDQGIDIFENKKIAYLLDSCPGSVKIYDEVYEFIHHFSWSELQGVVELFDLNEALLLHSFLKTCNSAHMDILKNASCKSRLFQERDVALIFIELYQANQQRNPNFNLPSFLDQVVEAVEEFKSIEQSIENKLKELQEAFFVEYKINPKTINPQDLCKLSTIINKAKFKKDHDKIINQQRATTIKFYQENRDVLFSKPEYVTELRESFKNLLFMGSVIYQENRALLIAYPQASKKLVKWLKIMKRNGRYPSVAECSDHEKFILFQAFKSLSEKNLSHLMLIDWLFQRVDHAELVVAYLIKIQQIYQSKNNYENIVVHLHDIASFYLQLSMTRIPSDLLDSYVFLFIAHLDNKRVLTACISILSNNDFLNEEGLQKLTEFADQRNADELIKHYIQEKQKLSAPKEYSDTILKAIGVQVLRSVFSSSSTNNVLHLHLGIYFMKLLNGENPNCTEAEVKLFLSDISFKLLLAESSFIRRRLMSASIEEGDQEIREGRAIIDKVLNKNFTQKLKTTEDRYSILSMAINNENKRLNIPRRVSFFDEVNIPLSKAIQVEICLELNTYHKKPTAEIKEGQTVFFKSVPASKSIRSGMDTEYDFDNIEEKSDQLFIESILDKSIDVLSYEDSMRLKKIVEEDGLGSAFFAGLDKDRQQAEFIKQLKKRILFSEPRHLKQIKLFP